MMAIREKAKEGFRCKSCGVKCKRGEKHECKKDCATSTGSKPPRK